MTPRELLAYIREKEVVAVDLRFMDFPGLWKHFTIPAEALTEDDFEDGRAFDGSSIRGWKAINEADMLVIPDPTTAFLDPFTSEVTLTVICNIHDPQTRLEYTRDPRNVARKAVNYMRSLGIAEDAQIGVGLEFFLFDDVRYDQTPHSGYYFLDSVEGAWNTGRVEGPNLGHKLRYSEGYFPCLPADASHDVRSEIMRTLMACGVGVTAHMHQVATGGQGQIDLAPESLVRMADDAQKAKYVIKNVARRHGKTATFMPKPLFGDNGSGMSILAALFKDEQNVFAGNWYSGISDLGRYAIGGLLRHAPALCAITNPTTNSYKRLIHNPAPPDAPPVNLAYSQRNRSCSVRVPVYSPNKESRRLEFRSPDGSSNPYLAFAAMLMAMIDGIREKMDPGEPFDKDIYDLQPEELAEVPKTPATFEAALDHLARDHEFLLQGDVFTPDVIDTWIWYKRENEVSAIRERPHPYEFALYFDI